jgi:hypothetical protein
MARVRLEATNGTQDGTHESAISVAEIRMRRAILVLLTASGLAGLATLPAEAVGTRYPFCITGPEQPGLSNCTFTSYEQCQATASGRRLYCVANPFYGGGGEPGVYRERRPPPGYPYSRY